MRIKNNMNTLNKLQKFFLGGFASLVLVAAVACSGSADGDIITVVTEPGTDQVTNSVDTATSSPSDTITSIDSAPSDSVTDGTTDSADTGGSGDSVYQDDSIQTAFEGDDNPTPTGDIAPEVVPEVDIEQLTPAEIVEAQGLHLADLYEHTVQSVVFIKTGTESTAASGSGFVWDTDGHIVTNYHVVQGSTSLIVKFFNGREYTADVVAFDLDSDLAVIQINDVEHELVPIAIGNSSDLRPGEMAIALGNPFGEEFTMTTGIVSAVSRTLSSGFSLYRIPAVIQTDTAINPGNSGGPLLDMDGAVIGVNTQIRSDSRQNSGVGFAVPVDLVKRVIPSLLEDGQHVYALMGISGHEVDIKVRENAGVPGDIMGALVMSATPDGPADLAGVRADTGVRSPGGFLTPGTENWDGDIIVSIDSVRMKSMDDLIAYLALNTAPGDDIVVGIYRDGLETTVVMTLGKRPSSS